MSCCVLTPTISVFKPIRIRKATTAATITMFSSFTAGAEVDTILDIIFNNPRTTELGEIDCDCVHSISDENLEQFGSAIAKNTHLTGVDLGGFSDHRMSLLFLGLTRSSSIKEMVLHYSEFSVAGVRSMVPFLQNSNNLMELNLSETNIQSEGFNLLFQALRNGPIEELNCQCCGIESIEINSENKPKHLKKLYLNVNDINADGCRELAKSLQGGDATLEILELRGNEIDDDGVEILVDALKSNTSLKELDLLKNDSISKQGEIMLLKLVNDISSIEATMQSNHTLKQLHVMGTDSAREWVPGDEIQRNIDSTLELNRTLSDQGPTAVGKEKIIQTQLNSARRAALCRLQEQEVEHSVFNEIDPLHLPEVLSLISRSHGHGEFYVAMLSSIVLLFSTMDRERCIQQEKKNLIAQHEARLEELDNELAAIRELAAVRNNGNDVGHCSNKRRRT